MGKLAKELEKRKRARPAPEDARVKALNKDLSATTAKLEVVRKMIVNADTIDDAGKKIGTLIEEIRSNHEALIGSVTETIGTLTEDRQLAIDAVNDLEAEKDNALEDLKEAQANIQKMAKEHLAASDKLIKDAVASMNKEASDANTKQVLKALTTFTKRLEQFDRMQNNILDLNNTMTQVLGVLQSPKIIEFDDNGMPIGVHPQ